MVVDVQYTHIFSQDFSLIIVALSYNQPKLNATDIWCENGITFASYSTIGIYSYGIYIDKNNTIYIPNQANGKIVVWSEGSVMPTKTISGNWGDSHSIFILTMDEEISMLNSGNQMEQ